MITYLIGDATVPIKKPAIIAHVCNNKGGWGAGFVLAISRRWREPEQEYRKLKTKWLGAISIIPVETDVYVANMIAQNDYFNYSNPVPLDYDALRKCLRLLNAHSRSINASIHMPRIGCGLAGGDWRIVSTIIEEELSNIDVYVYDLKENSK